MSLVDVDSWLTEYEACDRLNHTILTQLTQRGKRQRLSPEYNRLTASIQVGLKQFETELRQLKDKLDATARAGSTLTFEENERRQRQVETLQSQLQQLQSKYSNVTRADRSALLDQPSSTRSPWQVSSAASGGAADADADAPPIIETSNVNALKQRQIDILEDQNRGLEVLSQTISRQRALASQLGQEVEDQNDILDNLANTMESVDTRVHVETGNIGQVNRQDSTWCYWIVIIVLLVAIIIVGVV